MGQNFPVFKKKKYVKVLSGNSVLFGSTIVNCSPEETFKNVISRLQEEQFSERRVEKVSIENPVGLCSRKSLVMCPFFFSTVHPGLFFY